MYPSRGGSWETTALWEDRVHLQQPALHPDPTPVRLFQWLWRWRLGRARLQDLWVQLQLTRASRSKNHWEEIKKYQVSAMLSGYSAISSFEIGCFDIYGNICISVVECVVYSLKDDDVLLAFAHQKKTQQVCKMQRTEVFLYPFICSFQRRCMWKENKSMWRGCDLQPDER